jgi:hypothetical protein
MQIKDPGFFTRGKVILPPSPDLTVDAVQAEMTRFGQGKYEVYKTALIGADLVIKRSGWTGLALKIKHSSNETAILYNPLAPSALVRIFMMGFIPLLILWFTSWKELIGEFKAYVSSSQMFQR